MTVREIYDAKLSSMGITLSDGEKDIITLEVEQAVRNYTNLDDLPEGLNFVIANMCIDLTRYNEGMKPGAGDSVELGSVDSLKIGDTNIKLGGKGTVEQRAHSLTVDDVVMNYKAQLNGFRRMVWS